MSIFQGADEFCYQIFPPIYLTTYICIICIYIYVLYVYIYVLYVYIYILCSIYICSIYIFICSIYIYIYTYMHACMHTYIHPIPSQTKPSHPIPSQTKPFHYITLHYITYIHVILYNDTPMYQYHPGMLRTWTTANCGKSSALWLPETALTIATGGWWWNFGDIFGMHTPLLTIKD